MGLLSSQKQKPFNGGYIDSLASLVEHNGKEHAFYLLGSSKRASNPAVGNSPNAAVSSPNPVITCSDSVETGEVTPKTGSNSASIGSGSATYVQRTVRHQRKDAF